MKRIVIGTDGSKPAAAAVAWGARLAGDLGCEVVLATSAQAAVQDLPARDWPQEIEAVEATLTGEWAEPLRATDVELRTEVLTLSPALGLLDCAERWDADLVVVGSRGHGGFSGLLLGSVADHLAHHADRPLAVVPPAARPRPIHRIVLGLDGSDGSRTAAAWVAEVAVGLHVPVSARHVTFPMVDWYAEGDEQTWVDRVEHDLEHRWTKPLLDRQVEYDCRVLIDQHRAEALLESAGYLDGSMIAIGTRSRGKVTGMRLGGLTMQLLHGSQALPVVVVPAATAEHS